MTSDFVSVDTFVAQYNNSDVICSSQGLTRYEIALTDAESLFQQARANASKEIYFISDGKPQPDYEHGKQEAKRLRNNGVTIATIMVRGNDQVMRTGIASKLNGKPLHAKVNSSADLAAAIKELSRVDLVSGRLFYRAMHSNKWAGSYELSLEEGYSPPLEINQANATNFPNGIHVYVEFLDDRQRKHTSSGGIVWE